MRGFLAPESGEGWRVVLAGLEAISLTTAYRLDGIVQSGSVIEARSEGLDPQPCGPWISDLSPLGSSQIAGQERRLFSAPNDRGRNS